MKELFIKYVNRECTEEEVQQIVSYFQHSEDFSEVPAIEAIAELLYKYPDMEDASAARIRKQLLKAMRKDQKAPQKRKTPYWKYATAAAVVMGMLATGYFLSNHLFTGNTGPVIVNNNIRPGTDRAVLTLEDGSEVSLQKGTVYQTRSASSNGEEIVYQEAGKPDRAEPAFNTLTIPRGGQFVVTLSDGTTVWLNSESRLKYPVRFADGRVRRVELVYGEAYFEVSPSTAHKGSTFKVLNQNQEAEVLGTKFNIKAYKGESHVYTTLVEGKVAVSTTAAKEMLAPGEQSAVPVSGSNITIGPVDANREIAWTRGEFVLQRKTLKEIMTVLSRWYDMEVTFTDKALEEVRFVGVLGKDQNIADILNTIKSFGVINDYEIRDKNVILK